MARYNPYVSYGALGQLSNIHRDPFAKQFLAESNARAAAAAAAQQNEMAPVRADEQRLMDRWRGLPTWAQYTIGAVGVGAVLVSLNALIRRF